jgi:hypothetical protein
MDNSSDDFYKDSPARDPRGYQGWNKTAVLDKSLINDMFSRDIKHPSLEEEQLFETYYKIYFQKYGTFS